MKTNPRIDGLNGTQQNPENPLKPDSPKVPVNYNAVDGGPDDPCHAFDCITQQIFGFNKPVKDHTSPVLMNGFVANAIQVKGDYHFVMSAFNSTNLPVLSTLAEEFAVFDHWHCSCPCPTNPNREFLMSGTSHGMVDNDIPKEGFPQETHFAFLERHNVTWKIYYNDDPWMAPTFADLRVPHRLALVQEMPHFYEDVKNRELPEYVLIQPRMATSSTGPSNWQHPDNSVEEGEKLISSVYETIRNSTYWQDTLLIITYDEHGGFFDHQHTPDKGIPPPDKVVAANGFDFTRLGVRIPTVMVSPWIQRGTLVHEPTGARAPTPTSQYDATSIISSVNKLFNISEIKSAREAWAGTFHDLVDGSNPMRKDCPMTLPPVRSLTATELTAEMMMPFNDHHFDSINLLCHLTGAAHPVCAGYATTPARAAEQAEFIATLSTPTAAVPLRHTPAARNHRVQPGEEAPATTELAPAAVPLLRQHHFEAISRPMFAAYKAAVGVAA